jgi:thioester reductase-like protein
LKAANVGGTETILRLATAERPIPLHYISTLSVFDAPRYQDGRVIGEEETPDAAAGLLNGYAQTKWAAERLVAAAGERGAPVAIYRLGLVAGDSEKGRWGEGDFLSRLLAGCVQMGMAPALDQAFRLMPVDYAAEAIVTLAAAEPPPGRIFPLQAPLVTTLEQMRRWLVSFGYRVTAVSYPRWSDALLDATAEESELYALRPIFLEPIPETGGLTMPELFTQAREPHFIDTRTQAALAAAGLHCPQVDEALFHRYLRHFVNIGFLPPPQAEN